MHINFWDHCDQGLVSYELGVTKSEIEYELFFLEMHIQLYIKQLLIFLSLT